MTGNPEEDEVAATLRNLGLPAEHLYERRLSYHAGTGTLVLSLTLRRPYGPQPLVFLRRLDDSAYTSATEFLQINAPAESLCTSSLVLATEQPCVYFVVRQYGPEKFGEGLLMREHGIGRINLREGKSELWRPNLTGFDVLSELVGTDGVNRLFAIVGEMNRSGAVAYGLTEIDWADRSCRFIRSVPHIYY